MDFLVIGVATTHGHVALRLVSRVTWTHFRTAQDSFSFPLLDANLRGNVDVPRASTARQPRSQNDSVCDSSFSVQVAQLGELGLMGVAISEENGGTGLDYLVSRSKLMGDTTSSLRVDQCYDNGSEL